MLEVTGEGVQIGLPVLGDMPDEGFHSIIGLQKPKGSKLMKVSNRPIDIARNQIVDKLDREWLFFMDADVVIPPKALLRLLTWNLPIVSGTVFLSTAYRPVPSIFRYEEFKRGKHFYKSLIEKEFDYLSKHITKENQKEAALILPVEREDLLECDGVGTACLLIHRSVFGALKKPYFKTTYSSSLGEDLYFCRKVRQAGFKIYADPGVICGHRPKGLLGARDFLIWVLMGGDDSTKNIQKQILEFNNEEE